MQQIVRGRNLQVLISPVLDNRAPAFESDFRPMSTTLTIELPVRRHLLKFCHKEFGSRFSYKDSLAITVAYMLRFKDGNRYSDAIVERYPEKLIMEVPQHLLVNKRINPYLSEASIVHLDKLLDDLFKRELFKFVAARVADNIERQVAIELFSDSYNILESDISFEALKKAEFRHRQQLRNQAA